MVQVSYRERITRYVVAYMKSKQEAAILMNRPDECWSADIYRDLYQKYPRVVTLRMVVAVLRDQRVFEDVTEPDRTRYGRKYRMLPSMARLGAEDLVNLLLHR